MSFMVGGAYPTAPAYYQDSMKTPILAAAVAFAAISAHAATVSTVAGAGIAGAIDGTARESTFNRPTWLDVDARNGNIYVIDRANGSLRRIAGGRVTTLPLVNFSGNAPALDFGGPYGGGIAIEPESAGCGSGQWGEGMYLASSATNQVLLVADGSGDSSAVVLATREGSSVTGSGTAGALDGDQSVAQFNGPGDVALSWGYAGNYNSAATDRVYVADTANHTIRRVTMQRGWECTHPGNVDTLSGRAGQSGSADGDRNNARFNSPRGVATAPDGSIYVADTGNHTIRRIAPDGMVTTVAGNAGIAGMSDGPATESLLRNPSGIDVNELGEVFIADTGNFVVRKLATDGRLITIAGTPGVAGYADGPAHAARFSGPIGLRVVGPCIYIADTANNVIRKLDLRPSEPRRRSIGH
jgi:hypothetical protein